MVSPRRSSLCYYLTCTIAFILTLSLIPWVFNSGSVPHSLFPSLAAPKTSDQPRWLLAILLPPDRIARRAVIRETWATRFPNPAYEYRFILGDYKSTPWAPLVDSENATHGDIWALEEFKHEDAFTANHIKCMELFSELVRQQKLSGRRYDFVSKVDDDNWLNVPTFYNTFIAPRLPDGEKYDPDALTVIGRPFNYGKEFTYTSGRMYTVSWRILEILAEKYQENPGMDWEAYHLAEDMLPEYYLWANNIEHEFVPVEMLQAWDIGLENVVDDKTMLIHCIKHNERLMEINTIFDDRGKWNGKLINGLTNFNRSMEEVIWRLGEVEEEELGQLKIGWESWDQNEGDPWETLDWKLIKEKITIEDRVYLGNQFPMNLPGNNESVPTIS